MKPQAITTATAGIKLTPGSTIAFNSIFGGRDQIVDEWSVIADAGTPTLIYFEMTGVDKKNG